jgi:hypothetical protein
MHAANTLQQIPMLSQHDRPHLLPDPLMHSIKMSIQLHIKQGDLRQLNGVVQPAERFVNMTTETACVQPTRKMPKLPPPTFCNRVTSNRTFLDAMSLVCTRIQYPWDCTYYGYKNSRSKTYCRPLSIFNLTFYNLSS